MNNLIKLEIHCVDWLFYKMTQNSKYLFLKPFFFFPKVETHPGGSVKCFPLEKLTVSDAFHPNFMHMWPPYFPTGYVHYHHQSWGFHSRGEKKKKAKSKQNRMIDLWFFFFDLWLFFYSEETQAKCHVTAHAWWTKPSFSENAWKSISSSMHFSMG